MSAKSKGKPKPAALSRQLTSHLDQFMEDVQEDGQTSAAAESQSQTQTQTQKVGGSAPGLRFLVGSATDLGGGTVNQDKFDVFQVDEALVLSVFDGHGRELGELAAEVARDKMRDLLQAPGTLEKISEKPNEILAEVFKEAHLAIKNCFRARYERQGWQVQETEDGYLVKRKTSVGAWSCTHGGTTGTVVIIFSGSGRMLVANVGDSTALWGGLDSSNKVVVEELSAEHSPESEAEFRRIRDFRPDRTGSMPEMRFVFDSPSFQKAQCPPIFEVQKDDRDTIRNTNNGNYYKNVRNEWATLCTTPPTARFQDALAFTRSLGDLHLHVYGVTHVPEVKEYKLDELHAASSGTASQHTDSAQVSCLLVCTDGVWDNWKFPDIVRETLDPALLSEAVSINDGQKAANKIMADNISLAQAHFGSQADNMTAILCYVLSNSSSSK